MSNKLTVVRLLNVPLENDYLHTLYFSSKSAQETYFTGRTIENGVYQNLSYQRKDNYIRLDVPIDDILNANYIMYKNSSHLDKWYYAFITKTEYKGDTVTFIHIETDVIQTWFFDYTVKQSFVEREHVDNDAIGLHTIEEGLELGEFVVNDMTKLGGVDAVTDLRYILGTTANPLNGDDLEGGGKYNGIYSGVKYYGYRDSSALNTALKNLADAGKVEAITGVFIAPWTVCAGIGDDNVVPETNAPSVSHCPIDKNYKLNGYTPRNNKLKCFPYNYLGVSNNNGTQAIYKYEYFSGDTAMLDIYEVLCAGISSKLIPVNYKGVELNHDEGITGGKYPICNYAVDMYTNWLTQNSMNNAIGVGSGLLSIGIGLASIAAAPVTGGASLLAGGGVLAGASQVMSTLSRVNQASMMPDQARGNTNSGDVITSMLANCFMVYNMSIKKEYAQIIDGYFDMYGYKVVTCKTPNKNHRENYWYTQCINVNIDGNVPMEDMKKIKECYNRGITFWRNPSNIQNYTVSNNII